MTELNLTLKKDIFEALLDHSSNEIPIKKSAWWKKRLMDLDTGRFKWFDVAVVCSGSQEKYRYEIDHIESRDDEFVVIVVFDGHVTDENQDVEDDDSDFYGPEDEVIEPEIIEPEQIEPEKVEPTIIEKKDEVVKTYMKQDIQVSHPAEKKDVRELVLKVFDRFCKLPDVYVVNLPYVTIRNTGAIIGCNRRLLADRDSDVRIDFKKMELTQEIGMSDEVFLGEIISYLSKILRNSYVFVNKKYSGFAVSDFGELIFKIAVAPKKKYLFLKNRH